MYIDSTTLASAAVHFKRLCYPLYHLLYRCILLWFDNSNEILPQHTHTENSEMRTTVFLYKMNKLKHLHVERAGYRSYRVTCLGDNLIFIIVAKCLIIHIGC